MLLRILKTPARLALRIYCRHLSISDKSMLSSKGPLLIAANHPNSFLDAVVIATLFNQPVYSLARGDVFKNSFLKKILSAFNILPVYRISEGAENLQTNYETFSRCREIFKRNGIVLIFSEGLCVNEWKLRKLKKGTARLVFSSWDEDINLTVLPVGINYQSFSSFGKNIQLKFGIPFNRRNFIYEKNDGNTVNRFNSFLSNALLPLVNHIEPNDTTALKKTFEITHTPIKTGMLYIPAFVGMMTHYPLYIPVRKLIQKKAGHSVHYDSILVGALFFLYPAYLALIVAIAFALTGSYGSLLIFVVLPFLAWCHIQTKAQF